MNKPLVTVICLCHNHEQMVERAINSVFGQTYQPIELIVVDDASTDSSREAIEKLQKNHEFTAIYNPENMGNCRAFNKAFNVSTGKYLIDLAADDELLPDRIAIGVEAMDKSGPEIGVHFCDAAMLDENGKFLRTHYLRDNRGKLMQPVTDGDMYKILLEKYYISTPTMMMGRKVLDELGGYDAALSYEDFDFWIRSSRNYKYQFTDAVLMNKYVLKNSLSTQQSLYKNRHTLSTAIVCEKALALNKSREEDEALYKRVTYELKWAMVTENWEAAVRFLAIRQKLKSELSTRLFEILIHLKPRWYWLWKMWSNNQGSRK
jgi:glycosyltransferase involved in cell wall biosynthesis